MSGIVIGILASAGRFLNGIFVSSSLATRLYNRRHSAIYYQQSTNEVFDAGGYNNANATSKTNLSTNATTALASPGVSASEHRFSFAVQSTNTDVLFWAGGWSGARSKTYTISTNTWLDKAALPNPTTYKGCNFAVSSDIFYTTIGIGVTNYYKYDLTSNAWTQLASTATAANSQNGIAKIKNGILVVGGGLTTSTTSNRNEYWLESNNTWTTKAVSPINNVDFNIYSESNDATKIYGLEGVTQYVYNFTTNAWTYNSTSSGAVVTNEGKKINFYNTIAPTSETALTYTITKWR